VRIIAATNRDLEKALEEGALREDLYYRLNVILLRVPPLRERMDDVPILGMHFLKKYAAREGVSVSGVTDEAMNVLLSYAWPGNVRELENAIERAVVLGRGEQLRLQDLPPQVHRRGDDQRPLIPAHLSLEEIEKLAIVQALRLTGGNKSEAAERLGIHRTSIYDKMRRYGIEWNPRAEAAEPRPETAEPEPEAPTPH
jgi:two-component system response regulator HydG